MVDALILALGVAVIVGIIWLVVWFQDKRRVKELGREIRILLFEQVGKDKIFRGIRKGFEKIDDKLGVYIFIGKDRKAIPDVDNSDLFYDDEYGKALAVVKFADDDYRPMARLSGEVWFKKVLEERQVLDSKGQPVYEVVELSDPNSGELVEQEVPKLETVEVFKPYREPLGINMSSREAMRFERDYTRRMEELRKEKQGWFEKYAPYITVAFVGLILIVGMAYTNNKTSETQKYIADTFAIGAQEYKTAVQQPTYAEKLLDSWEKRQANQNAPPS